MSGIKRHIAVDTLGWPHAIAITPANVTDREGGLLALSCRAEHLTEVRKVLVDGGYTGVPFAEGVSKIIAGAEVTVVKRHEPRTADFRGIAQTLDRGTLFCLAGKMPTTVEKR